MRGTTERERDAYRCECGEPTRLYAVQDTAGEWSLAQYCAGCAHLGRMNWAGNHARIVGPFKSEQTGGGCTALVAYTDGGVEFLITREDGPSIPEAGERFALGMVSPHLNPQIYQTGIMPETEEV